MTDDMFDHMGAHEVATVASQAMNMMERLAVPATPDNFSTWFNYAAGSSPSLRKSIDALLGHERKFDASVNRDLYATHIRQGADIGNIPEQLHGVIASARQFLSTAIADNRSQIATLGEVSSQFQVSSDPRPIIEMLVAELSNAAARATSLEARFHETSRELDLIRDSLKIAERRSYTDALTGLANRRSFDEFFRLGQTSVNPLDAFSMTVLALRASRHSNGVSRLHGDVSRTLWKDVWAGVPGHEVPITSITNGVHTKTWMAPEFSSLYQKYLGDWEDHLTEPDFWRRVADIPDAPLWETHQKLKQRLVEFVRQRVGRRQWTN